FTGREFRRGSSDLVVTFNIDEYWGLPPDHPMSFAYYLRTHLLQHVNVAPENAHWPDVGQDPAAACQAYEDQIRAVGGLDLAVLGIGHNGHIGRSEERRVGKECRSWRRGNN